MPLPPRGKALRTRTKFVRLHAIARRSRAGGWTSMNRTMLKLQSAVHALQSLLLSPTLRTVGHRADCDSTRWPVLLCRNRIEAGAFAKEPVPRSRLGHREMRTAPVAIYYPLRSPMIVRRASGNPHLQCFPASFEYPAHRRLLPCAPKETSTAAATLPIGPAHRASGAE